MKLEKYLELTKTKHKDFAKKIGVSPQSISNYIAGKRKPNLDIACVIEMETKGKVTIHDF